MATLLPGGSGDLTPFSSLQPQLLCRALLHLARMVTACRDSFAGHTLELDDEGRPVHRNLLHRPRRSSGNRVSAFVAGVRKSMSPLTSPKASTHGKVRTLLTQWRYQNNSHQGFALGCTPDLRKSVRTPDPHKSVQWGQPANPSTAAEVHRLLVGWA